jgi:hypothetical protein
MTEVGQLTPYSLELIEDVPVPPFHPSVALYDTFADPVGTKPERRDAQWRWLFGRGPVPAKPRVLCGTWATDNAGYAYPSAVLGDTNNLLQACELYPAGTASDRRLTVVINEPPSYKPGGIVSFDGRYVLIWEMTASGSSFRIRQADLMAGYPTFGSAANAWVTLATSGNIPGYVNTADQEFVATLTGGGSPVLTVTHTASGTSISTTPGQITIPIGPECGFKSTSANAKIKSIKCEPIGTPTFFDIGNGVKLIDARVIEYLGDADGVSLAIRADGLPFLAVGNSSNQNGTIGGVYTASQTVRDLWATTAIDINSGVTVEDRWTGLEGVCLLPIDDYRYLFVNDTPATGQFLLDLVTKARVQLSAYSNGQDCRVLTIDGELCIVSTHEGGTGLSGIANGGVVIRRYLGGDPMSLASWQNITIPLKGAWALQKTGFGFVDLDGDTLADQIVVGVRDGGVNSDVTAPGFYPIRMPADPWADPWTVETALYTAANGTDVLNWDFGDFSGDGNGLDLLFVILNEVAAPKYLRKSTGWTVTNTITLGLGALNTAFNIMKMPVRGTGTRDGWLAWVQNMGLIHGYWDGAAWQKKVVRGEQATHGWNCCNGAVLERGDGTYSVFIGNSFGNALLDMRFK